jgi:hypothetical protein
LQPQNISITTTGKKISVSTQLASEKYLSYNLSCNRKNLSCTLACNWFFFLLKLNSQCGLNNSVAISLATGKYLTCSPRCNWKENTSVTTQFATGTISVATPLTIENKLWVAAYVQLKNISLTAQI